MVVVEKVIPESIADECGICPKDLLVSINGHEINDVLDYRFYLAEEEIELSLRRGNEELVYIVEKEMYEDLGLEFETPLMDKKHRCENKCIFCFIDQLPKGLRKSLYFKDDGKGPQNGRRNDFGNRKGRRGRAGGGSGKIGRNPYLPQPLRVLFRRPNAQGYARKLVYQRRRLYYEFRLR